MKKCNRTIRIFTFVLLFASFLFAPVSLVMADDAASGKTTPETDKDADKKKQDKAKKGKKGDDEEEPECE